LLLSSVLLLAGCRCGEQTKWLARIRTVEGGVTVEQMDARRGTGPHAAMDGEVLTLGHKLTTGPDGRAVLDLMGGGVLKVKPDSEVLFGQDQEEGPGLQLTLARGSVESAGDPEVAAARELVIAVGERKVKLARATRATVSAPRSAGADPGLSVSYGEATVVSPGGRSETVVAGEALTLTIPAPGEGGSEPDAGSITAPELVLYIEATGRGRVTIQPPGAARGRRLRRGEVVQVLPGTRITLARGAAVRYGPERGTGAELRGPARLMARKVARPGGAGDMVRLESEQGGINLRRMGKPGQASAAFTVQGVQVLPRITHREVDLRVQRDAQGGGSTVSVVHGEAVLTGATGTLVLEAGQEATLSGGAVDGPREPAPSGLTAQQGERARVFLPSRGANVTLAWTPVGGGAGALVEVARDPAMSRPLFADVIRRSRLTLARPGRGTLYWRVRPAGSKEPSRPARLTLLPDTSSKALRGTSVPHNVIQEQGGNTTVYYQNRLPRFTFRWKPIPGASRYLVKVLREQDLHSPVVVVSSASARVDLPGGRLGEGRYIWYVVGRDGSGARVATSKNRTLVVRYDNATPALQIISPREGQRSEGGQIMARGVALRGSKVFIGAEPVPLDESYRFERAVSLRKGSNRILFRVVHPRTGVSLHVRQVTW